MEGENKGKNNSPIKNYTDKLRNLLSSILKTKNSSKLYNSLTPFNSKWKFKEFPLTIAYSSYETSKIIIELRKKQGWSQADLANKTNISQVMVGKYERGDALLSLEVAKRIADAFEVLLDFLVGEGINANLDKKNLRRLEELQLLDEDKQEVLYDLINTYIKRC